MPAATSKRLDDGFATLVELANFPSIKLYEKEVTPAGMSGGGPNETTTMRNSVWRTKAPKKLKTMTQMTYTAAYADDVYEDLVDALIDNQLITVTFPDGATLEVWGWLDDFKPNAIKEGEQPTAMVTFECSNQDDDGNEVAPVYTPPPA